MRMWMLHASYARYAVVAVVDRRMFAASGGDVMVVMVVVMKVLAI